MEKKQYDLCVKVLRRLEKAGILKNLILIGSWCLPFYKRYFHNEEFHAAIRTRDLDFLIAKPESFRTKVDLFELVKDLGFTKGFRGSEGYIILEHPDLAIELLVPERGRGSDKPVALPKLGVNAQALRFLELLAQNTITVKVESIPITMPHPANFALQKLIISGRRRSNDKSAKDIQAAIDVLKELTRQKESHRVKDLYDLMPSKWQSAVLKAIERGGETPEILIK